MPIEELPAEAPSRAANHRAEVQRPRSTLLVVAQVYVGRMRSKDRCPPRKPAAKIWWSGLGALLGILAVQAIAALGSAQDAVFLIGSFGASAVLVYGAPLAEFSQPRNLLGGHVLSAAVGVGVAQLAGLLGGEAAAALAPAVAVAASIVLMHYSRTLHPPGGASALIAVIGSRQVQDLGWWYLLCPVACGAVAMLAVALVVNNLSTDARRHYPAWWW